jgi:DNA topoisomerase-1
VLGALDQVAQRLGNTRAVCRKCYVHPVVLEKFLQGTTLSSVITRRWTSQRGLDREEQALLAMLDAASANVAKVA